MLSHALVIPCFNEAKRLKISSYRQFIESHPHMMICLVDDGSSDNTLEIISLLKDHYPNQIRIITNQSNRGKAEAVRIGINSMLAITEIQYFGFLDADLSTEFEEYVRLMHIIDNNHFMMIFGSRKTDNKSKISYSLFRFLAGRVARVIIKGIVKLPITDTQCGAKIFSREAAEISFTESFKTSWLFDVEIFLRLKKYKGKGLINGIKEVYLNKWTYKAQSNFKVTQMMSIPIEFIKIMTSYRINPVF